MNQLRHLFLQEKQDTRLVAQKIKALLMAIDNYNVGEWAPKPISSDGSSSDQDEDKGSDDD